MRKKALRKCSSKKSHCKNKICFCVSENKTCSSLCQCIDCVNQEIEEEENSSSEEEEEAENLQEIYIDSDMDFEDGNIFEKMISDLWKDLLILLIILSYLRKDNNIHFTDTFFWAIWIIYSRIMWSLAKYSLNWIWTLLYSFFTGVKTIYLWLAKKGKSLSLLLR